MSISSSLGNALSGLSVTSRMAEVTSSNIANALTPGYSRRTLEIGSSLGGVQSYGVNRHSNPGLISDRRLAQSQLGFDQRSLNSLTSIERSFGVAGSADSIAGRLASYNAALINAANDPSSDVRLGQLNSSLGALVTSINTAGRQIQEQRQDADSAIARDVEALNTGLAQVARLNADISRARLAGQDPSNLRDSRQQVIDDISSIVPVRLLARDNDQAALMTTSGLVLLDGVPSEFEFTPVNIVTADMTLASGGLSGISRGGVSLDSSDGIGRLSGGSLGAAMQMRDETLVDAQTQLDEFAFDLAHRHENPAIDPTFTGVGLITDMGGPTDPADFVGLAGRLAVNAAVDPTQGGDLSKWRDGVGAVGAGPIGESGQLARWLSALNTATSLPSGGSAKTSSDHIGAIVANVGTARIDAEKSLSFSQARWESLHQAVLADGVDSDNELQNLIRIEQAYAANAKVMQTISAMMQQLMEI